MTNSIPVFRKHKDKNNRMIYTIYSDDTLKSAEDTIDLDYFMYMLKKHNKTMEDVTEEFYIQ